jgi:uncharacterized protein (DUF433 family)
VTMAMGKAWLAKSGRFCAKSCSPKRDEMASQVEQVERMLSSVSRAEKAEVLQAVVRDLGDAFPGIESTPGICGGDPRIVRTRSPVWALVSLREQGASDAEILAAYPDLRAEDVANAWAYDRAHHQVILDQIREQDDT